MAEYNLFGRAGLTRGMHHFTDLNLALVGGVLVATPITEGSGLIHSVSFILNAADTVWLKLYNKSTLVAHATDDPDWQFYLPGGSAGLGRIVTFPIPSSSSTVDLRAFSGGLQIIMSGAIDGTETVPLTTTAVLDLTIDVPSA